VALALERQRLCRITVALALEGQRLCRIRWLWCWRVDGRVDRSSGWCVDGCVGGSNSGCTTDTFIMQFGAVVAEIWLLETDHSIETVFVVLASAIEC
jgi:hypothetical protein